MSTSILAKLSSELFEASSILADSMKRAKQGPEEPKPESFRDYLRRVMKEENLTDRQIEDLTGKLGHKVSRSWVNLVLTQEKGVANPGIKTLASLAKALNRSRDEVFAKFFDEPIPEGTRLTANIETLFDKLPEADRAFYERVLEDIVRSMRRAIR